VGCYDPRLGAVVVATHTHEVSVSQVLKLDLPASVGNKG
ncbi:MAG TPA: CRISPR-associated protein Csx3, partial [Cyanobacteria bacterium UBA11148]|nr:CRISPR-associated protein Csx3 [Cyanobacteria bacterium UBA11148]